MDIGITYDLRSDFGPHAAGPEDRLEEYDSEATVDAIAAALASRGHAPRRLGGGRRLLETLLRQPPELVFNIAEGFGGRSREAQVPAVLEMLGVPYTHSDPLTLALTLDKSMAKRIVAASGLPTPRMVVLERADPWPQVELRFPVIAKPLCEGSSMGIRTTSRLESAAQLRRRAGQLLLDYGQPVLVEEFCPGPEYTVGVLGSGAGAHVLAVMEIVPRHISAGEFVYSLEVKRDFENQVEYVVPPRRPPEVLRAVEALALAAYRALGCRDIGRVDLRTAADGEPQFLEVNPLPGLNPHSADVVIMARRAGWTYEDLIGAIVQAASERQELQP